MCTIHDWLKGKALGTEVTLSIKGDPEGKIFWLDSMAGTGKCIVAQTIAYYYPKSEYMVLPFARETMLSVAMLA